MSKYYTPKIEEIHFSLEFYIDGEKKTLEHGDVIPLFSQNLQPTDLTKVKIKYLDEEDLKELGFVPYKTDKYENHYVRNNIVVYLRPDEKEFYPIGIFNKQTKKGFSVINVKNKSELKKLIKQLNI